MRDELFGKYAVFSREDGRELSGPYFVLRVGDPHADAAIDTDPELAMMLHDCVGVTKALDAMGTPYLTGCVPCPIWRVWNTPERQRIRAMLAYYAHHVHAEAPSLAESLLRALYAPVKLDTTDHRRLAEIRALRAAEKSR